MNFIPLPRPDTIPYAQRRQIFDSWFWSMGVNIDDPVPDREMYEEIFELPLLELLHLTLNAILALNQEVHTHEQYENFVPLVHQGVDNKDNQFPFYWRALNLSWYNSADDPPIMGFRTLACRAFVLNTWTNELTLLMRPTLNRFENIQNDRDTLRTLMTHSALFLCYNVMGPLKMLFKNAADLMHCQQNPFRNVNLHLQPGV